jgi:hypothetical protein
VRFGTTFSEPYARSLGLEPRAAFRAIGRELGLGIVRLCTYWDRTEPEPGRFDFASLEWQAEEALDAGLEVILTVGQKAPRWPEFYLPPWLPRDPSGNTVRDQTFEERLLTFIERTVTHFRGSSISTWQVENEPYIAVNGPRIDEGLLRREIELVRRLSGSPVMLTESAGKRDWRRAARWCDILGVNLYTRRWKRHLQNLWLGGYVDVNRLAKWYARRAGEVWTVGDAPKGRLYGRKVMVAELQAEPWGPQGKAVHELTPEEAQKTMDPVRLRANVALADEAGFETALLWGAEWWYWLRERRGDDSMWEAGKREVRGKR